MAFLPLIPQPNDQQSTSQGNILDNFIILGAIAGNANASSASINIASGFNWINLPSNGAIPPAGSAFPANNIGLYSAVNNDTNKNELYINKTNQATVKQIPATASSLSITSAPASNAGMWTYLPSGLLLKSGGASGTLAGLIQITPAGSPFFTQILSVIVCPWNGSTANDLDFAVRLVDINSNNTFRIFISKRTSTGASTGQTGYQFLAIGY